MSPGSGYPFSITSKVKVTWSLSAIEDDLVAGVGLHSIECPSSIIVLVIMRFSFSSVTILIYSSSFEL